MRPDDMSTETDNAIHQEAQADLRRNMFRDELMRLLNRHSMENGSNTPDFILASYLVTCLDVFDTHIAQHDHWNKPGLPKAALGPVT